jgi:hypothetical protein
MSDIRQTPLTKSEVVVAITAFDDGRCGHSWHWVPRVPDYPAQRVFTVFDEVVIAERAKALGAEVVRSSEYTKAYSDFKALQLTPDGLEQMLFDLPYINLYTEAVIVKQLTGRFHETYLRLDISHPTELGWQLIGLAEPAP